MWTISPRIINVLGLGDLGNAWLYQGQRKKKKGDMLKRNIFSPWHMQLRWSVIWGQFVKNMFLSIILVIIYYYAGSFWEPPRATRESGRASCTVYLFILFDFLFLWLDNFKWLVLKFAYYFFSLITLSLGPL